METVLGLSPAVGGSIAKIAMDRLGKPGPDGVEVLLLSDLALHGFIEHDASLTRRDARNGDAAEVLLPLVDQLVALSQDGKTLTLEDLTVAHQLRLAQSGSDGHDVPAKAATIGMLEAALYFSVMARDGAVALPDVVEFFAEERIPASFAPQPVGWAEITTAAAEIFFAGNVPTCEAAQRAQKAIHEVIEPDISRLPVDPPAPPEAEGTS